jgi:hypothetical protein
MFLFYKLILAHLVADFIFQFDELYHLKIKSLWGHAGHGLIHALIMAALVYPYLGYTSMWVFIIFIAVVHLIQDVIKYRWHHKTEFAFPIMMIDQIIHVLFLALILLLPLSQLNLRPLTPTYQEQIYFHETWTFVAILFVLSTFAGSYILHAFRKNYFKDSRPDHFITSFEIIHALLERSVIAFTYCFATNISYLLLLPAVGFLRFANPVVRNRVDFWMSILYAGCIGALFRQWL